MQATRKMLLISSSKVHGCKTLEFVKDELIQAFQGKDYLLFIPFARASGMTHDEYTNLIRDSLKNLEIDFPVKGLHEFEDYQKAIKEAKIIFTGGGNTYLLLTQLYNFKLLDTIREVVNSGSCMYMGASAGSNITGLSIQTTNDMPIIHPPSFEALGLINFNINPHYLDPDTNSKHKGETRETRLLEFQNLNNIPVLGVREGGWLEVVGDKITLRGKYTARFFEQGKDRIEIEPNTDVTYINELVKDRKQAMDLASYYKN